MNKLRVDDVMSQQAKIGRETTTQLTPIGIETLSCLSYYKDELLFIYEVLKKKEFEKINKVESIIKIMLDRSNGNFSECID